MRGKQFRVQSMLATRKRGSPTTFAKDGYRNIGQSFGRMNETKTSIFMDIETDGEVQQI